MPTRFSNFEGSELDVGSCLFLSLPVSWRKRETLQPAPHPCSQSPVQLVLFVIARHLSLRQQRKGGTGTSLLNACACAYLIWAKVLAAPPPRFLPPCCLELKRSKSGHSRVIVLGSDDLFRMAVRF